MGLTVSLHLILLRTEEAPLPMEGPKDEAQPAKAVCSSEEMGFASVSATTTVDKACSAGTKSNALGRMSFVATLGKTLCDGSISSFIGWCCVLTLNLGSRLALMLLALLQSRTHEASSIASADQPTSQIRS